MAPFPGVGSSVQVAWAVGPKGTLVRQLDVSDIVAGATIEIQCDGDSCPFKVIRGGGASVGAPKKSFAQRFRGRKLAVGTVITVTVSAPQTIGRVVTYVVRKGKKPLATTLCLPPGSTRPTAC